MPFANKFRAMTGFPCQGEEIGGFLVESVDVGHHGSPTGYTYPIRMVLCGAGGKQGVRRALKELFGLHPMTFSGYGNPYQLWFAGFEVESLGDKRYEVTGQAAGARVHLGDELERFLDHLQAGGMLADDAERAGVVDAYLEGYQSEVRRTVGRYRSRLRRSGENEHS